MINIQSLNYPFSMAERQERAISKEAVSTNSVNFQPSKSPQPLYRAMVALPIVLTDSHTTTETDRHSLCSMKHFENDAGRQHSFLRFLA
jgi:hypothetical protein